MRSTGHTQLLFAQTLSVVGFCVCAHVCQVIARLDAETRQERVTIEREHNARLSAAEARNRDIIHSLQEQVKELESRSSANMAAVTSRERALASEVEGLKEDLTASREEVELLRMEAIASNRLAEDCQRQLDSLRVSRTKERDDLRRSHEEEV
jgi:hypothetical protein